MRHDALEYLCCPREGGALHLKGEREVADGHVMQGELSCGECGMAYTIQGGVPRLAGVPLTRAERRTKERFGDQWSWYRGTDPGFAQEFWDYVAPLTAGDLRGKVVLDAGCGNGRLALAAATSARAVLAVDFSTSVEVAFAAARHLPHVHVVQGNLLALPVRAVDVAYCIGVLHHLENPDVGFARLVEHVTPGGTIAVWVYAREGNDWLLRLVEPVRRVTSTRAPTLVKALALPGAGALWAASLVARTPLVRWMPLGDYLRFQGRFGFGYLWLTAFDKLTAPTAHYIAREELTRWLAHPELRSPVISFRNSTGWRAKATRVGRPGGS